MSAPEASAARRPPMPLLLAGAKDRTLRLLHERLAEEGFGELRYKHGEVFRLIDEEGSRLTDLADRSGVTKQGIGETIGELEQFGYVERVPAPDDRRAKIIRLTARGRRAQLAAARILGEIERDWAARFGEDRVIALRHVLQEIVGE
ncbi:MULTISPECIES: MarR family winged helix-turn-helix transcriptional regulator [Actinoalloteichus]|uniref:Winged helix DNA-binding domain n=1 Tax=Actinoalloteichus fjordicus TaxID=1612552 RepID=A0AAC9LGZ1_9PSEU|nr:MULTISPECIES: MarR family winged helix-turn-helix transcriptional regulator [Actinoalloteichus]APU16689.1 Winged helix DNA-binding domain [Actinoalloteichus fjordicus]APU22755.1 Winged helix DNA-binding domain [Actinoalloteichus sp. GBA129-24]